jgi:hypothetical protein
VITANSVDVTNNAPLPGAPGTGPGPEVAFVDRQTVIPGNTARFTLYVNNTSSQPDAFDLAASTVGTFASITLPAGWTVTFRDGSNAVITSTGPIAGGGNMLVYADVDVPAGNGSANVELYFRAHSPVSAGRGRDPRPGRGEHAAQPHAHAEQHGAGAAGRLRGLHAHAGQQRQRRRG